MKDPKLIDYIKNTLDKGFDENRIRLYLISKGISFDYIDDAFLIVKGGFFKKAMYLFKKPNVFFDLIIGEELGKSFMFFLFLIIIYSILVFFSLILGKFFSEILNLTMFKYKFSEQLLIYFFIIIITLVAFFMTVMLYHAFIFIFGGKDIRKTLKIFIYSLMPFFLAVWMPFIGPIISLYSIFLLIVGIKKIHNFGLNKAVIVSILPLLCLSVIIYLILLIT